MILIIEKENFIFGVDVVEMNCVGIIISNWVLYVYKNYLDVFGFWIGNVRCVDGKFK